MIAVKTNEGLVFTGVNAQDIARQMRNTQWGEPVPKGEYIQSVIYRICDLNGEPLPPDWDRLGAEAFLLFLEAHGLVTISDYVATAEPP